MLGYKGDSDSEYETSDDEDYEGMFRNFDASSRPATAKSVTNSRPATAQSNASAAEEGLANNPSRPQSAK